MLKKHTYIIYSILICLFTNSCLSNTEQINKWFSTTNVESIDGKYHNLSPDGIKIYLPSTFKKYNGYEYQKLLDSLIEDKNDVKLEYRRLKELRNAKGNFYIFFDEATRSTYTINALPYMPLRRQDAKYVLGMISSNNTTREEDLGIKYTKLTAKYNATAGPQVFKAIYKIETPKQEFANYNSTYIVSYNKKTVFIMLSTGFEADFDPFLAKMIL